MKKISISLLSTFLLFCSLITPIKAVENDSATAGSLFDELKDKYDTLSNNFGNVTTPNSEAYEGYLQSIQNNKESLKIDESLNAIKNFNYSTSNNKYINDIMQSAKTENSTIKADGNALSKAFEEKYAKAEADAKARQEKAEATGKTEYNKGMDEYSSVKSSNEAKIADIQETYKGYLNKYSSAATGGNDLSGQFKKYGLPAFDDILLGSLCVEMGIMTPKVRKQQTGEIKTAPTSSTKTSTPTRVYTSNAYQAG